MSAATLERPRSAPSPVPAAGEGYSLPRRATIDDLYHVEGKAELVNGEIVHFMPTGGESGIAGDEIFVALRAYIRAQALPGRAIGDNKGFRANLPHRQSFSPDAAYYTGPVDGLKFFETIPRFAVEVRSENDYGPAAETNMAIKRADYFAAGTVAVWDVDLLNEPIVRLYVSNPETPVATFTRGETAHAEPAVPGWTMLVDDLFG